MWTFGAQALLAEAHALMAPGDFAPQRLKGLRPEWQFLIPERIPEDSPGWGGMQARCLCPRAGLAPKVGANAD